jgi:predicted RNA-binding Zn-ribbon protein involved in translation (DUF1610 family)
VAVLEIVNTKQLKRGIGGFSMKCPNCGKEMEHFFKFIKGKLTAWYECDDCKIWEEDKL